MRHEGLECKSQGSNLHGNFTWVGKGRAHKHIPMLSSFYIVLCFLDSNRTVHVPRTVTCRFHVTRSKVFT
ncbi:hypothetical protein EUGRSUZ_H04249 [Eucalyptus grandis]|uniref:Uncharacterized protein n=2 Tax=Eucalyptus grandis TaxID=71139 RepID=A0ACC3JX17_EUCGR|nr:hypothetical protein EUGRSUZ_H04249 [Eucalyptus grandis]